MSIPAQRPPPPALPVAILVGAAGHIAMLIALTAVRIDASNRPTLEHQRSWFLFSVGGNGIAIAAAIVCAAAAISLARSRRSAGAALTAAAFTVDALTLCLQLVVTWLWPTQGSITGWRLQASDIVLWSQSATTIIAPLGLCAAGWADRAVRLLAPGTLGAALIAASPRPLISWAYSWVEHGTWKWNVQAGAYEQVPDYRMWIVPGVLAVASLGWGVGVALLVSRQPPVPMDTVTPRPPAPALRRFAVSLLAMAAVAVAVAIAIEVHTKPSYGVSTFDLVIPIAVGLAAAGVAATLVDLAVADVVPTVARRSAVAAIAIIWCVAVLAAQTLARPRPSGGGLNPLLFSMLEQSQTMPPVVGAGIVAIALLNIAQALSACAQQAGLRPSRGQQLIVILALAIGTLTTPWVLGFGARGVELDSLRIATLVSAALVNLAAWIALARSAWRAAAALDEAVLASAP